MFNLIEEDVIPTWTVIAYDYEGLIVREKTFGNAQVANEYMVSIQGEADVESVEIDFCDWSE